jgi:predicted phosphodiesterase
MKVLVLADIHGRSSWEDIIKDENPDLTIFLGDYVSSHGENTVDEQITAATKILDYKQKNSDKVIMLRGNHDMQHVYPNIFKMTGFNKQVAEFMSEIKDDFMKYTQWCYIDDENKIIYSHAGVSTEWMNYYNISDIHDINSLEPSYFDFTPGDNIYDCTGDSITQSPIWIRPLSLCKCCVPDYTQIVGHTPIAKILNIRTTIKSCPNDIWLCDTQLKQYMIIDNNEIKIKDNNF